MGRYAILGTGAVGGYYGGLLAKSGQDVHFLLRTDFAQVKKQGLRIDSVLGNFHLEKVQAYDQVVAMPKCDIVMVAWKTTDNGQLKEILPQVLKPGGIVLVLQNGLDPEADVAAILPEAKIIGGMCFLCARKEGPGWIQHLSNGAITLAAYAPGNTPPLGITSEMRILESDLCRAGVEIRMHEDWRVARWTKLVWNIPFNGLCALLDTNTSKLLCHPPMRSLISRIMGEVVAGAKACGVVLPENIIHKMLTSTDAMDAYEPSMKLDFDAGRPLEIASIYGSPCSAIQQAGGTAANIEALFAQLSCLETI